jgi:hypothetical protein
MEFEHLIILADTYGGHEQRSDATIAKRANLHTRFFERLRAGEGVTVRGFNRAMRFFQESWPEDLDWPPQVPRPSSSQKGKAA